MYNAFQLHIWDVGVNFDLPFLTSNGIFQLQPEKWDYLLFVPLMKISPSPFTLILAEDFLMALSGFFIFLVAKIKLKQNVPSLVISSTYLFSYIIFGAPYFPSHYQILFSAFFIISFYSFLRKKMVFFSIFIVLSAAASNLGAVTSLFFLFYLILRNIRLHDFPSISKSSIRIFLYANFFFLVDTFIVLCILLSTIFFFGSSQFLSGGHINSSSGYLGLIFGFGINATLKILYLTLIILPFGPAIFKSKYSILLVPYLGLTLSSSFNNFFYLGFQYSFDIGVILFLIFIDNFSGTSLSKRVNVGYVKSNKRLKKSLYWLVLVTVVLDIFILPFGPMNFSLGDNPNAPINAYDLQNAMSITPNDRALSNMISYIPLNASILIQENMPQLTNRQIWFEPGSYNGSYPIQYILTDPWNPDFTLIPPSFIGPYTSTMYYWYNTLYQRGTYGIKADYNGSILLELGYSGPPLIWSPYKYNIPISMLHPVDNSTITSKNLFRIQNDLDGHTSAYSQTFIMPPGKYNLTLVMSTNNISENNTVTVGLSDGAKNSSLPFTELNGSIFNGSNKWVNVTLQFNLPYYFPSTYFAIWNTHWTGKLLVKKIFIIQTGL